MNSDDLKTLKVAAAAAKYTPLQLRLAPASDGAQPATAAAVPVRVNSALTGVLLALPNDFLSAEVLSSGPYAVVEARFRGAGGRELTAATNVLLVDIDIEALEVEGGSLDLLDIGGLGGVTNFGASGRSTGPSWLSARSLKEAAEEVLLTWMNKISEHLLITATIARMYRIRYR